MVSASVTPNTTQSQENRKRREYTIERAKANHLTRQLQLRLQYARLKVEHGWQKQNLNEVENLYFHHSHQRGPQPYPPPSIVVTTHREPTSSPPLENPPANTHQSSLSFRLGSSTLSRNTIAAPPPDERSRHPDSGLSYPQKHPFTPYPYPAPYPPVVPSDRRYSIPTDVADPSPIPQTIPSPIPQPIPHNSSQPPISNTRNSPETRDPTPTSSMTMVPPLQRNDTVPLKPQMHPPGPNWSAVPTFGSWPTQPQHTMYSTSYHRSPGLPSRQSTATILTDSSGASGSSSTLTYDSFWSSHQSSSLKFTPPSGPPSEVPPVSYHASSAVRDASGGSQLGEMNTLTRAEAMVPVHT